MDADYTDHAVTAWRNVLPDLDPSPIEVVNRIIRLARRFETSLDAVATAFGLSRKDDFDTLAALRRTGKGGLSPTQLAEAAMITTGGMTSRLDRLEAAGLIERHVDPHDRRALLIHLTPEGSELVDSLFESTLSKQQLLLEGLSSRDRETLAQLLRRLLLRAGDE